ncbi:unnamed protein product [Acanthosepion pharaonis]|uniref:Uncharacterized protein n=1 Tax=Acanthosepion pharaonis TaxID=158019 RepID=A0A812DBE4_ACAPH|nr:unnamed protein product [Sepia pharaonis]
MAKAPRPTGLVVPTKGAPARSRKGSAPARARSRPPTPPIKCNARRSGSPSRATRPRRYRTPACASPKAYEKKSSNPMENNNMMPNSAKGSIDSGLRSSDNRATAWGRAIEPLPAPPAIPRDEPDDRADAEAGKGQDDDPRRTEDDESVGETLIVEP